MITPAFLRIVLPLHALVLVALVGCQSTTPGGQSASTSKTDYSSVGSKLMEKESFGGVRIGSRSGDVVKVLGEPESKSKTSVSEVDAKPHQEWTYTKRGVVLDMVAESGRQEVAMITVGAPSTLETKRGIGIGSSESSVKAAYAAEIDPSSSDARTIVAGTVYSGLIFGLENGRVASMILGAVAE